jgi:hypothetical protein
MNGKLVAGLTHALFLSLAMLSLAADVWVLREDGVGPVKIGMTPAQLSAALHAKLIEEDSGSDHCYYVHPPDENRLWFMILDGRVVRVDVNEAGVSTSSGIGIGDSEAGVRQVYGTRLRVTAHKYVDSGHYLTVRSTDGRYGVRFETDKGKVTKFYAGKYDAIQYVEGCE